MTDIVERLAPLLRLAGSYDRTLPVNKRSYPVSATISIGDLWNVADATAEIERLRSELSKLEETLAKLERHITTLKGTIAIYESPVGYRP